MSELPNKSEVGKNVTVQLGTAYHNRIRGQDEVITCVTGYKTIVGAARFWNEEGGLHIGMTGSTDTLAYDWNAQITSFTLEQVIDGILRGAGWFEEGVDPKAREQVKQEMLDDEDFKTLTATKEIGQ